MNSFKLVLASGIKKDFEYNKTSDLFMILNQNQIFTTEDFKKVKIEIPNDLPKSRIKEVRDAVSNFKIPIVMTTDLNWERLGVGGEADWESEEALISRGIDITNKDHVAAFISVINDFKKADARLNELRKGNIVKVDGGFYIKKLEAFQVKRIK